ncbi:hypothetical protein EVAR_18664_1 [Eumeta japonica]|uniref:Uncharacterized protein n=1 Tax=Eumeta variegata TaxID=151549 RepID=A0A4C1U6L7_EUMVA|nr:hypothetical protein EVAR_18664_1 [Eumeta japonica]
MPSRFYATERLVDMVPRGRGIDKTSNQNYPWFFWLENHKPMLQHARLRAASYKPQVCSTNVFPIRIQIEISSITRFEGVGTKNRGRALARRRGPPAFAVNAFKTSESQRGVRPIEMSRPPLYLPRPLGLTAYSPPLPPTAVPKLTT